MESRLEIEPLSTKTNDAGEYEFRQVVPGKYSVMAYRNGYLVQLYGQKDPLNVASDSAKLPTGSPVVVRPGETIDRIDIQACAWWRRGGSCVDHGGEPLCNVNVGLSRYASGKLEPTAVARTDDLGQFRLFDVLPGTYDPERYLSLLQNSWLGYTNLPILQRFIPEFSISRTRRRLRWARPV